MKTKKNRVRFLGLDTKNAMESYGAQEALANKEIHLVRGSRGYR
jgi:hypothetical protein